MSDANFTALRVVEETVAGTTPASPVFEEIRMRNPEMEAGVQYAESEELESTGQVTDAILVGRDSGGGVNMEMSYHVLKTLVEGALRNAWSNKLVAEGSSEVTAVDDVSDEFDTAAGKVWALGMLVYATGFPVAANNGLHHAQAGSGAGVLASDVDLQADTPDADSRLKLVGFRCASGDAATDSGAKTLTISATSGDFTDLGLSAGEWVKIGNDADSAHAFATDGVNGWARLASDPTATTMTFDIVPSGWATDTGTGKTIDVWIGDRLVNGTTRKTYSIEVEMSDLAAPEYHYFTGQGVNELEFSADAKSILLASAGFVGIDSLDPTTTRFTDATTVAPEEGDVFNSSSNVGRLAENGADIDGPNYVTSMSITVNNNIERRDAVAYIAAVGLRWGRFRVSGQFTTYYGSKTFLEKLRGNTATSYDIRLVDPNGTRGIVIDLPRVKYTDGNPDIPGIDSDRTLPLDFLALKHSTLGYTMLFARYDYFE